MKYIIVAKDQKDSLISRGSPDLNIYTELGWELVGTRLDAIRMLQENEISKEDVIVTLDGRKFLYTKIFNNVISYNDFLKNNIEKDNVVDLSLRCQNGQISFLDNSVFLEKSHSHSESKYYRFHKDFDLIVNLDFANISHLPVDEHYYCVCLRYRSHTPGRNSPDSFWVEFLNKLSGIGKTIFIVGKGSEPKANGKNIIYIDNLGEYASLINNRMCRSTIGSPTGTMLLGHFCCTNRIFVVDHSHCLRGGLSTNNAVLGGKGVRFMDIEYNILDSRPNVDSFIEQIL